MFWILGAILSPTRIIIDRWKRGYDKQSTAKLLKNWNMSWLISTIFVCVGIGISHIYSHEIWRSAYCVFAFIALSRCDEILYAFYKDAIDRIELGKQQSSLRFTHRINLIILGYINLIFCFGIMHIAAQVILGAEAYKRSIDGILDALYFSAVTITTTGYGDIVPVYAIPKLLCIYEPLAGIILFTFALAVYLGGRAEDENE